MIKLVIFDLDGTLVNSVDDLADSVNNVLTRHNCPVHAVSEYYHFVGDGTVKLIERALPEAMRTEDIIMSVHSEFAAEYEKNCLVKTKPYDSIEEMLSSLEKSGIMTAVASNKTDVFTREIVRALFTNHNFSVVQGKLDGVPKKPDPTIVHMIMDKLGVEKPEVIYVGDSDVDVYTGHNCGLLVCGCLWGFRGKAELSSAGADYLLEKPSDLIDIISKL